MRKRTNYQKVAVSLLLVMHMVVCTVFAAPYDISINGQNVSVIYPEVDGSYGTMIYIYKGTDTSNIDNLVYAKTGQGSPETIELQEYGVFTVIVGNNQNGSFDEMVIWCDPSVAGFAKTAILGATNDSDLIDAITTYNGQAYYFESADITNEIDFISMAIDNLDNTADITEISAAIQSGIEVSSIDTSNATQTESIIKRNKDFFTLSVEQCADLDAYAEKVAEAVVAKIQMGDSAGAVNQLVCEQLALVTLNAANRSDVITVLERYFGNSFYSQYKSYVNTTDLQKKLEGHSFTTYSTVTTEVNALIKELYDAIEQGGNTGNGSGFGSGGGGGGAYAPQNGLTKPVVDELNNNSDITSNSKVFDDINDFEWAEEAIIYLNENKIMTGDGNGKFRPGNYISREEIVKVIIQAFGNGKIEETPISFADVKDEWYKPYVMSAFGMGIVKGLDETTFGVGTYVTREDAATMIRRAADAYLLNFQRKQTLVDFTDYDDVSSYAKSSVDILARAKIINGFEDGSFKPKANITRAEAAKIVYNSIKSIVNK